MEKRVFWCVAKPYGIGEKKDDDGDHANGFFKIYFEEDPDKQSSNRTEKLSVVTPGEIEGGRTDLFITRGFDKLRRKVGSRITRIEANQNLNYDHESGSNFTRYVADSQTWKASGAKTMASVISLESLPPADNPAIILENPPLTRHVFFNVDQYCIGPFVLSQPDENEDGPASLRYEIQPSRFDIGGKNIPPSLTYKIEYEQLVKERLILPFNGGAFSLSLAEILKFAETHGTALRYVTAEAAASTLKLISDTSSVRRRFEPLTLTKLLQAQKGIMLVDEEFEQISSYIRDANTAAKYGLGPLVIAAIEGAANPSSAYEQALIKFKDHLSDNLKKEVDKEATDYNKIAETAKANAKKAETDLEEIKRQKAKAQQEHEEMLEKALDKASIEEEINQKREEADGELTAIREKIEDARKELYQYGEALNLTQEIADKETVKTYLEKHIEKLESSKEQVQRDLKKDEIELQNELRRHAPFVSALISAPLPSTGKSQIKRLPIPDYVHSFSHDLTIQAAREQAGAFVQQLSNTLYAEHARGYSPAAVAAILVAQTQNFLTVYSGPPGIGKTSFARIMGSLLGQGARLKEVSVGKNWVSDREFLGFHNSLTGEFAPAPSGMYQFLHAIKNDDPSTVPTQSVLLDEANLSVIEQYWSPFMVLADNHGKRSITIGNDEVIPIPETLRFVATTNHDSTTEVLSPRLLDRAPVIQLDALKGGAELYSPDEIAALPVYSAETLELMFSSRSVFRDNDYTEATDLRAVIDVLTDSDPKLGNRFSISRRKEEKIDDFVRVVVPLLREASGLGGIEAQTLANDYAVLFFILPTISGIGSGTENRVANLTRVLSDGGMALSAEKLTDMVARAEHSLGSISYFQY